MAVARAERTGHRLTSGCPQRRWRPQDWPFLIVCPQKPEFDRLWPSFAGNLQACSTRWTRSSIQTPPRRSLTGLSQGGNGTLVLAKALPWRFAALAAVCGWADPRLAAREPRGRAALAFPRRRRRDRARLLLRRQWRIVSMVLSRPLHAPRLTLYPRRRAQCVGCGLCRAGFGAAGSCRTTVPAAEYEREFSRPDARVCSTTRAARSLGVSPSGSVIQASRRASAVSCARAAACRPAAAGAHPRGFSGVQSHWISSGMTFSPRIRLAGRWRAP